MGIRTPTEAVEYATANLTTGYNGMCLAYVQDAYGAVAVEPSAISAWNNSRRKHPTTSLADAPYGAPIYFSQAGNPYGHVAIHLTSDRMLTSDSGAGHPHEDSISLWQSWGYQPLGWTEDIEGQTIPQLGDDMTSAADVWGYNYNNSAPGGNVYNTIVFETQGKLNELKTLVTAQTAAIEALAKSMGADPDAIAQAVQQAVKDKLDSLEITISAE